uniref:Macro domain-containing protein n=1 Tax=Paramormyrops kingsleyae TaxID=1676925 RepID=A0A3B3QSM5_9TELE
MENDFLYPVEVDGEWGCPNRKLKTKLQIYFQSKKKSNGGDCVVEYNEVTRRFIVSFKSEEVRRKVLEKGDHETTLENKEVKLRVNSSANTETIQGRKHHIYQVPVNVYPFYTSIGTAQYGKDRPRWKLPDPFTESIHPCVSVKHIDSWKKNATDAFQNIMTKYKTIECVVNNPVWTVAEKEISSLAKQDVILLHDQTKGVLTVAGLVQDVDRLKQVVEGIVHKVTNQIERATQIVSDELQVPPGMFYILQQDGLQQEASHYPEMTYAYKSDVKKLILSGLLFEVLPLKSWILEHRLKMKQKQVEIEPDILSFLSAVNSEEMSSHLFTSCGIAAVYGIDGSNVVLTGNSDKTLADAQRRLRDALTFQNIAVKDWAVLSRPEWQILHEKLKDTYSSSKKNTVTIKLTAQDRITVSGFCEDVKEVCESLSDFINRYTRVQEVVQVQSTVVTKYIHERKIQTWKTFLTSKDAEVFFESKRPRIQLKGTQYSIQEVKNVFNTMILKDTNCMVVLQEDVIPEEMEEVGSVSTYCKVQMPNGLIITVAKADLCKYQADVVVNASNEHLQHIGGLALALLQAAGPQLQDVCDHYRSRNGDLKPGDAIITEAGKIPCQYVIHAVGPRFSDWDRSTAVRLLRRVVRQALNLVVAKGCRSVAIPAISSGIFGFPLDLCTETIAGVVREHCVGHVPGSSSLNEIHLVNHDEKTAQAMTEAMKTVFSEQQVQLMLRPSKPVFLEDTSRTRSRMHTGEGLRIWLRRGNIQDAAVSTRNDYKLTHRGQYGQHDELPQATGPSGPLQQSSSGRKSSEISTCGGAFHFWGGNFCHCDMHIVSLNCNSKKYLSSFTNPVVTHLIFIPAESRPPSWSFFFHLGFFSQISTPSLGVYMMRVGSLMLEVSSGDITKQNTDAIVNSSNESFTLKTGDCSGFAVEDECSQPHKGYLLTQPGQLSCKNIIHIVGQTDPNKIKVVVYKVLQVCEEKRFGSVSFPAISTGAGGVSPSLVADAMINAVVDFEKMKKGQSLKSVKIVVFQAGMMADFHRSLKTKEGTVQPEEKSIFSRIKDTITSVFGGTSVPPDVEEDFTIVGEEFTPAIFQFCGESHEEVSKAKKYVQDLIMKEQMEHTIKDSCIGLFTQEDCRKLQDLQKKLTVSIHLEKRGTDSIIQLEGLSRDVLTANDSIKEMMRKVESLDRRKCEAVLVGAMVEWQHDASGTFIPFDPFTNLILEQAFDNRCAKVEININNLEHMADLTSKEAFNTNYAIYILHFFFTSSAAEGLPGDWDDMKGSELLEVPLGTSSTEYQQVEAEFRKTGLNYQIIKVLPGHTEQLIVIVGSLVSY